MFDDAIVPILIRDNYATLVSLTSKKSRHKQNDYILLLLIDLF